jgi:hypothetical protein
MGENYFCVPKAEGEVKMMRRLGPMRQEVTGSWRDFNAKKLHNLYFSHLIFIERSIQGESHGWDL